MAATTGYQAAIESTDTQLSYAVEVTWGTAPAVQFQAIRYAGEKISGAKGRARPTEVNANGEASSAVTQSEAAGGSINFALSWQTYDDWFAIALANEWQALQAIAGVAGDIALTNTSATTATLISTTAGKFTNISAGQWIRLLGFTNAANNNIYYVASKVSALSLVLTTSFAATVTETPTGTLAQVRASMLTNGTEFRSVSLQQKLSPALYFRYGGMFVTGMQLDASVGQFVSGSFTTIAISESTATTDQSTGAILAAPTGRVHDTVAGIGGVLMNEVIVPGVIDTFSLNVQRDGATANYGLGSAAAQGMVRGTTTVSGTLKMYFKDFTQYAFFKAETQRRCAFVTKDAAGNAYVITLQASALMNPGLEVTGPNQPIMATFQLEGNPAAAGGTIQIDRLAAT